jgi:hypothetical protein
MSDAKRTEGEPHDRLTRLTAVMTDALEADPEGSESTKCVIFLRDGNRAGVQLHGYESDIEAMADVFVHLVGVFEANGKQLKIVPLRGGKLS